MSFGGFKFGAGSTSAPNSSTTPAIPSFSLTNATPTTQPSQPFSFGASTSQQPQTQQQQGAQPGAPPNSGTGAPAGGSSLFGGFGQSQNQAQGQAQQPQQQPSGGLFGGGSSLFGNKAPASTPNPAPAAPTPSGGLFGGSSLFGSQNQQQQQPQPQQQQPQGTTSLFGQSTAQQPSSGLFGQFTSQQPQQQTQASGSLFGQSTTQAPKPSSGLFGSTSTQPQWGQSQSNQLGASTSGSSSGINKNTRFTDLPENAQRAIEQLDTWMKQQKEAGKGINAEPLGQAIWQTSGDIKAVTEESAALTQGLSSLQNSIKQLRDKFVVEEEDLRKVAEIWDTYKSTDGRPGAMRVPAHRDFPQEFFARAAVSMEERVGRYRKTIAQLQRVIVSLTSNSDTVSPQVIAQTIQNHQNAILTLAASLEQLQLRMNRLRAAFVEDYRERTNSMRDPFEVAREERGLPPVRPQSA